MKKLYILSIIVLSALGLRAQLFEISNDPIFRDENGSIVSLALAGGLNQPQFSSYDFNKDGKMDLFVFDRTGNKVLVFISETTAGNIKYRYDPSFEEFFPKGKEFMQLHDYNSDGKPDLWAYQGDSVMLYKDVTTTVPQFDVVKGLLALDKVNYVDWNPNKKLSQITGCLPAIYDVDGDSDIDFVTNLNIFGSNLIFNRNNSIELGNPLTDIGFTIVDKCYGGIAEYGADLIINAVCDNTEAYFKKKHSASKTLMFFDNDGDGDNDLFFGSSERATNPVYYLENGKADLNHFKDTFINIDTAFFSQAIESQIPIAPGMFYLDIDLDGVQDLIMSNNDQDKSAYDIRETNNVLLFLNKGATDMPSFDLSKNNFLVGDMVDYGGRVAPIFADLDGDGDQDLVMATSGDHYLTHDTTDFLVYYQNIGSTTNPDFKLITKDYISLKTKNYRRLAPAFADLDGDSDLDLLLGKQDGTLDFYENTGSSTNPSFILSKENYGNIMVEGNASPAFADLNNDGKIDLLVGNYAGTVGYYENSGSTTSPSFTWVTDSFGGIVVNELISQRFLGSSGEYDSMIYYYYGNATPQVITYSNGLKCLAVGCDEGTVKLYDVSSDLTQKFNMVNDYMKRDYVHTNYVKDWGKGTYPAVADLNGDGLADMLIGNLRGGVHYVQAKNERKIGITKTELTPFRIVPNPTADRFIVVAPTHKPLNYTISNLNGQIIAKGITISGDEISDSLVLSNGIYFVSIKSDDQQFATQKLVISK